MVGVIGFRSGSDLGADAETTAAGPSGSAPTPEAGTASTPVTPSAPWSDGPDPLDSPAAPDLSSAPGDVSSPTGTSDASSSAAAVPRQRIPQRGDGEFATVPVSRVAARTAAGRRILSYTVEIEQGLPFAPVPTARRVDATLADPRGWADVENVSFLRVETGSDQRVLVASPDTTDQLCAPLQTRGQVSCRAGDLVVLNARRWAFGIEDYRGDLLGYRRYVVNHEIGHALGRDHVSCPAPGEPAPVMAQQTYGLQGCRANSWPTVG